jgi:hypothetical protein
MPAAKPKKTKLETIAEVFGIPVDPEDTDYVRFLYDRRDLATVAERGHREVRYIIEVQDVEQVIWQALDRIRERDGKRIFKEAKAYLQDAAA